MKKVCIILAALLLVAGGSFFFWQRDQLYRDLNAYLACEATELALSVTVGEGDDALHGEYVLDRSGHSEELRYSYEQLAEFELRDGVYIAPPTRVERVQGNARVSEGKLILLDGRQCNIALESVALTRMEFKRAFFSDVVEGEGSFEATVTDPQGFLGLSDSCEEMHLTLRYGSERIEEMTLSYRSADGQPVTMAYLFTY